MTRSKLIERLFVVITVIVAWTAAVTWLFNLGATGAFAAFMVASFLALGLKGSLPDDPNWS